mgnify:CR=1 FL=1
MHFSPGSQAPLALSFAAGAFLCWYILDGNTIGPQKQAVRSTCATLQALTESAFGRLALARRSDHRISEGVSTCTAQGYLVNVP